MDGIGYAPWPESLQAHLIIAPVAMPPGGCVGRFQVRPVPHALAEDLITCSSFPKQGTSESGVGYAVVITAWQNPENCAYGAGGWI
jgi:hypothetical protein